MFAMKTMRSTGEETSEEEEEEEEITTCDGSARSLHDEEDGLCIAITHKTRLKEYAIDPQTYDDGTIQIRRYPSCKEKRKLQEEIEKMEAKKLDRLQMQTKLEGKQIETSMADVHMQTDLDNFTNELRTGVDHTDDEKSVRRCLLRKQKQKSKCPTDLYPGEITLSRRPDEFRELKIVLAVLIGLILGGALFLVLHYCFNFSIGVSGGVAGTITLVMCVIATVSVHARCVVVLMSVGVFTSNGRVGLLCVITGILLTGPVVNIAHNMNQAINSMACITELASNQSLTLHRSLELPLKEVGKQLHDMANRIRLEADVLNEELEVIKDGVASVTTGIDKAKGALDGATVACKQSLQGTFQQCEDKLSGTIRKCQEELSKLDPGKTVKAIIETLNPEGWFARRKRLTTLPPDVASSKRIKRGIEDVCNIFDVEDVCEGLEESDFCKPVTFADDQINDAIRDIMDQTNRIKTFFEFRLSDMGVQTSNETASKSGPRIVEGIHNQVKSKLAYVEMTINIINICLSVFLLAIVFQAYIYKRNYLASITYDNVYITEHMKFYDASRMETNRGGLLPLRKHERKNFVDTSSARMLKIERHSRWLTIALVLMHMTLVSLLIFFEYVLFYILFHLRKEGNEFYFDGSKLGLDVKGYGPVTEIFKTFIAGFNSGKMFYSIVNVQTCLPHPVMPDQKTLICLAIIYVLVILLTILKAYGLRLRSKIASFYFPLQEKARISYLHRTLEVERTRFWTDRTQLVTLVSKDTELDKDWEWSSCKDVDIATGTLRHRCLQCEKRTRKIWRCGVPKCNVVLCINCYKDVGERCPVCDIRTVTTMER